MLLKSFTTVNFFLFLLVLFIKAGTVRETVTMTKKKRLCEQIVIGQVKKCTTPHMFWECVSRILDSKNPKRREHISSFLKYID